MKTKIKLVLILFLYITSIQAKVKVASVLGDNMILKLNTVVQLWGTAQPNEKLSITTGWNSVKTKLVANENGKWLVKVKTTEAGGPYNITIALLVKDPKLVSPSLLAITR